jgi:hypothetical protein
MPSRITRLLASYTRYVAKSKSRDERRREADRAAAEAEEEWWQEILVRVAEDERQEFHEENERWMAEVMEHEELMKKQDEEIRDLKMRMKNQAVQSGNGENNSWHNPGIPDADASPDPNHTPTATQVAVEETSITASDRNPDIAHPTFAEGTYHIDIPLNVLEATTEFRSRGLIEPTLVGFMVGRL